MPPKNKFTKEQVINQGIDIIRKDGISGLTARNIAKNLNASPKVIFGLFLNMQDLQVQVIEACYAYHLSYLKREMEKSTYPPYKMSGMAYVKFAKEEKEIFKLLFMSGKGDFIEAEKENNFVINALRECFNISEENAKLFHLETWTFVHGIAVMIVSNQFDYSEELISTVLTDVFLGLKYRFSNREE